MPQFDAETVRFSAANALLLARLCDAAYGLGEGNDPAVRNAVLQLGCTGFIVIDLSNNWWNNVYAIAAGGPGFVVVAFRGTKNFKDWMTDLQCTPVNYPWIFDRGPDVGSIHAGFGHALRDTWEKIRTALENLVPAPGSGSAAQPTLWLTGHSLGGALAVLTGAAFSMWSDAPIRSVNGVYTFGQPRVGLYRFCGSYDQVLKHKTFRFVNKQDLVPRVPFRGWDYADLGEMIHFSADGTPRRESTEWRNFLNRTFQSFREFFNIAGHAQSDVIDHGMDGYAQLVENKGSELDALFA